MEKTTSKYSGYGYHGGGRKATGRLKIFANTTISGTPEEIEKIKKMAKDSGKSVSRFLIDLALNN
ncbi:MAG: hypothetical protein IJJ70_05535 [Treponema sp.]|nr:hypothetical protein [bacterium]MBR0487149.1 hypothetical protein [Treponema sp.]